VDWCYWALTGGLVLLGCDLWIGVMLLRLVDWCHVTVSGGLVLLGCNWWIAVTEL
jgi:hypothetical protein